MSAFTKWVFGLAAVPICVLALGEAGVVSVGKLLDKVADLALLLPFNALVFGMGLSVFLLPALLLYRFRWQKGFREKLPFESAKLAGLSFGLWFPLAQAGMYGLKTKGFPNVFLEPMGLGFLMGLALIVRTELYHRQAPKGFGKWFFRALALLLPLLFFFLVPHGGDWPD